MGQGRFIAKWPFRCGYCRRDFKAGTECVYIMKHEKRSCMDCADDIIAKVKHGQFALVDIND